MSWSNTFTQSSNVNGGNEYTVYDVPTASMFNIHINNTQYLYEHKLEKEINDGMFYGKFDYNTASPYLRAGDVGDSEYSELDVQSNGIYLTHYGSGTTTSYNIFDKITDIETRLVNLGFKYPSSSQIFDLIAGGGTSIMQIIVSAGSNGNRNLTSREGNRTILKFDVYIRGGSSYQFLNFYQNGTSITSASSLLADYRPKTAQTFITYARVTYTSTNSSYGDIFITVPIKVTLRTDGTFLAQVENELMPTLPGQLAYSFAYSSAKTIINQFIGYQSEAINS